MDTTLAVEPSGWQGRPRKALLPPFTLYGSRADNGAPATPCGCVFTSLSTVVSGRHSLLV